MEGKVFDFPPGVGEKKIHGREYPRLILFHFAVKGIVSRNITQVLSDTPLLF
jgi:hypothetical protein